MKTTNVLSMVPTEKEPADVSELMMHTAEIAMAYFGNNTVSITDVPSVIANIYGALSGLGTPQATEAPAKEPAVSIRASVRREALICLDCGTAHKMIKRHLSTAHGLTPAEYRAKWNLPATYPMTAPAYAEARRQIALDTGLGRRD